MSDAKLKDAWASGEAYEPYVGRWSRLVAAEFLSWLAMPPQRDWLDVGCGTGALSRTILDRAAPRRVVGVDASAGFVAFATDRIVDPRATFRIGDAQALPVDDGAFDACVSGLAINFIPDPRRAVAEMLRAAKPGGAIAAYVWDYAGDMQLMRRFWDAAAALDPAAEKLDEGRRFPICAAEQLRELLRSAGLSEVVAQAIDIPTAFRDFDDYWSPFLGGQGPAPGYCMSLPEPKRIALRDRIKGNLPISADGSIDLKARAWAVKGRK